MLEQRTKLLVSTKEVMDPRKREADAASPARDNASTSLAVMDNDRKRRDLAGGDEGMSSS